MRTHFLSLAIIAALLGGFWLMVNKLADSRADAAVDAVRADIAESNVKMYAKVIEQGNAALETVHAKISAARTDEEKAGRAIDAQNMPERTKQDPVGFAIEYSATINGLYDKINKATKYPDDITTTIP